MPDHWERTCRGRTHSQDRFGRGTRHRAGGQSGGGAHADEGECLQTVRRCGHHEHCPRVAAQGKKESNSVSERELTIFLPGRSLPRWPLRWPRPMRLCWSVATTTSPMTWHAWWPNCLHRSMPSPVWICPRCCRKFPAPRREICWTGMCNKWRWQRNPQGIVIEDDSERDKAIKKERGRALKKEERLERIC